MSSSGSQLDANAIVVPAVAVQAGPEGQYVYVVKSDQDRRDETCHRCAHGRKRNDSPEGVKPGETVVTDGQLRLVPGSRITVQTRSRYCSKGGLMNLTALFIKRPITTTLITLGIVVFGVMSYRVLPVADLPAIDFPTISVNASLPGASPETMASAVALPLEKQFSTISGLTSMNSTNTQGSTNITLQFDLSRDIDAAAQDVQTMIARATRQLPAQMPSPPSYMKVNPGDYPVMLLVMRSPSLPLTTVNEYADSNVSQRISTVNGVAQVNVFGPQKYAVRIDVDPRKLSAHGIGIDEVVNAIQASNVNLPTGTMAGRERIFTVLADGQLLNAASYAPMVIAYRNGNPVRLADVARVYDGVEQDKTASWYQGTRNISLMIQKQPGSNVVAVVDQIKELLPPLRAQLPPAVQLDVRMDRSESIRESVHDVKLTLWIALGLVIAVIFIFLRNVTATVIPSLTLPVSLIGTFSVMYLLNYSLDNLSLMALTLCIGFVVDDTIVMLENIERHMEMGKPAMRAAFDGAREVEFTIIAMTASLVAVFIPVLFMGGIVGRLLQEFAVTIGVAILVSCFVSISLTPMLCSRFLKTSHGKKHGRLYNLTERMFDGSLRGYDVSLQFALRHRAVTMAVSLLFVAGAAYLFVIVPKGFLPSEDQGRFNVSVEGIQGIGFEEMVRHQQEVAAILAKDPDIAGYSSSTGEGGGGRGGGSASNQGRISVDLKPRAERTRSVDEIIASLRPKLAQVPGVRVFMVNQPPINLGGMGGARSSYQFTLQDPDTAELYRAAPAVRRSDAQHSQHRRRQQRPAVEQSAGPDQPESRQNRRVGPDREPGRNGPLQCVRHSAGFANLCRQQSVPGDSAGRAGVSAGSGSAVHALCPFDERKTDSAQYGRKRDDRCGPALGQPHRPASVGEYFIQLEAGSRAWRCGERHRAGCRDDAALDGDDEIPGNRAGISGVPAGSGTRADHGDRRDLHRARHSL